MRLSARIAFSLALPLVSLFLIAAGSKTGPFEGRWKSEIVYDNGNYELLLSLATNENGRLTGNLRILEAGYEFETLGLDSVVSGGDSLKIQTGSIDGRGANFQLKSLDGKLVGRMGETYSGRIQGATWEVTFEKVKE